jgi:transposase
MGRQEHVEVLRTVWNLQGFDVVEVEIEPVAEGTGKRCLIKQIRIEDRRRFHQCPQCGKDHEEGLFQETEERRWRERSMGDFETWVVYAPWRVTCCGGTRVERFPWEAAGHRMTRYFFELLAALCRRLPVSEVARMAGLSWDTVARVDKESIALALGGSSPSLDGLRWIGVDEVSRTGGHVYFTVVTDLQAGRVVWIGEGKKEESLAAFFRELGPKRRRKIVGVVSDLSRAFVNAIAAAVPNAIHLLDRFHIIQWVNEALDEIRRATFGGAPRDTLGRSFKVKKWMLLRAREALDLAGKRLLSRLLSRNRQLNRAYLLKESLRGIFQYPWIRLGALRNALLNWCHIAIYSRLKPMVKVGYRLRENLEKLIGGFEHAIKMGLVESINGKIGQLRRQGHGYRDPEYFKLKIYQRCSLHDDPWAQIIL